jgi:hypothetical protein
MEAAARDGRPGPAALGAPGGPAALRRLWLLAAAAVALTLATPSAFRVGGDNAYMALAALAGLVALAATRVAEGAPVRAALWLIVGVALLLRGVLLFAEPLLSTDIYRYVWDGRVQAAGINPYRYVPADEALAGLRDAAIYPRIHRADYAVTVYPPVAQMFFFAATRLGETATAMKLALLAGEGVAAAFVVLLLGRLGRPPTRVVAYAWHPLPLWEIANNGHVDALMVALMMAGIWLAVGGRPLPGAVSIALGALVKPFALPALAAAWRPWDWKLPSLVALVAALCYAPYLAVGWGVFGFLATGYLQEEALATGGNFWALAAWRLVVGALPGDVAAYLAGAALVLAAMAVAAAKRAPASPAACLAGINRLLLALLFLLSPSYPWYFLAVTPFVALVGGAPAWTLSLGAVVLQEEFVGDWEPSRLARKSVLYGAFLLACAYEVWRSRRQGATGEAAGDGRRDAR